MKLSLSSRIAESFYDKTIATLPFEDVAQLAKENGYRAICMRASVAGIQSSVDRVKSVRQTLDQKGLRVSMVTGDFAIPENLEPGPGVLRNITPYLNLAEAFACDLLRICMKREEDIAWAQRASDEAADRGMRLAHQCHVASLFETIEGSVDVLERVNRPNFGIIYEPANLKMCGESYGIEALNAFKTVSFQRLPPKLPRQSER